MSEDEVKAAEEKTVNQLTDKAEAERNQKKAKLAEAEIANLERDQKLAKKLIEDPENTATLEEIADAKLQVKKDEKQKLKLKEELAETSTKIVADK